MNRNKWYSMSETACWNWYNRNIAYRPTNTECELIVLRGNFNDKKAIKIPKDRDTLEYRKALSILLGITIQNRVFITCNYSSVGEERLFNVHQYYLPSENRADHRPKTTYSPAEMTNGKVTTRVENPYEREERISQSLP